MVGVGDAVCVMDAYSMNHRSGHYHLFAEAPSPRSLLGLTPDPTLAASLLTPDWNKASFLKEPGRNTLDPALSPSTSPAAGLKEGLTGGQCGLGDWGFCLSEPTLCVTICVGMRSPFS